MVNKEEIAQELHAHFQNANTNQPLDDYDDYEIDQNGLVHVHTDIQSVAPSISGQLPVQFSVVDGDFLIRKMKLTSLVGAPTHVEGIFDCSHNLLTSLEHAPKTCADLLCQENQLTSLSHAPMAANSIDCSQNLLTDLSTCPRTRDVFAAYNPFENFRNTPTHIEKVTITYAPNLPLLGLLVAHHVDVFEPNTGEYMKPLTTILNDHVGKGVSNKAHMLKCAIELIKAGYKGNARW
jgi:hypothetical protein